MYSNNANYILASIAVFLIAIYTDRLDGQIARKRNLKSIFGTFFDPLVDKMLILSIFFAFSDLKIIPLWIVLIVLCREFLVTGIRQVCSKPTKVVGANWMGKSKFLMQSAVIIYTLFFMYFNLAGSIVFFNQTLVFWINLIVALISLGYAGNFLYWHRKEILKGI